MKKIYLSLLFVFTMASMHAQLRVYKTEILKANDLLMVENYNKATSIYDKLLKRYPNDKFIQFKAGECFLFSEGRLTQCIELLEKASEEYPVKGKKSREAIESRYYLGQAYHLSYRFEDALKVFNDLKKQVPKKEKEALARIDHEIQYAKNAMELKNHPVKFKISNLGPLINTEFDEHSPVVNLHEDLLLFTSKRKGLRSLRSPDEAYDENVYFTQWRDKQWLSARPIDMNTRANNATIGISPDGSTLLIYQNDGLIGNIYTSKFKNDKWGELEKMPSPINTMANETHASFSMDGNTLFFTSDRSGGFGGKDIYAVTKLPNGQWGKVRNLGAAVNTDLDEESPYIHPNGNTLYFSSEGHNSMGGFDIFKASMDSAGTFSKVKNIGYPINTPFDDLFYAPTIDEQRVYYASKRDGGLGGSDIYLIEFPDSHLNALTVVGGFLFSPDGSPAVNAKITVTHTQSGKREGIYRPSPINGKYIFIIPSGMDYTMEVEMKGHKTVLKDFNVPSRNAFARKKHTFYLDPIVLKNDVEM